MRWSFLLRGARPPRPPASRVTALDQAVERLVAPWRRPSLDRVFYSLSSAADHGLLWLLIGAVRATVSKAPAHSRGLPRLVVAMGAESFLTNVVLKTLFRRVRPRDPFEGLPLPYGMRRPLTSAFPSGHAASAFTAATLLADAEDDERLVRAYYLLAAIVAASRVYVRMHHTSDVLAGSAWGLVLGNSLKRQLPLRRR